MKKPLNIGLVGYGFMGRTHSNAFLQTPRFFDVPFEPVLKTVCARNPERVKAFVEQGGGCRATFFNHRRRLQGGNRTAGAPSP